MGLLRPFHAAVRLRAALIDPVRRERTCCSRSQLYVVLWTIYGTIAKASQDLHPDMTELIAWSRDLASGISSIRRWRPGWCKPGSAFFRSTDWSYYLLAMLMPASALWIVWRLSADYFDIEKRISWSGAADVDPVLNFHALKFNVNTVLLPTWAATTFWFLRSYKTHSALYAGARRHRRRRLHAGKILVGVPARRTVLAALFDQAPRRLFPVTRAMDHGLVGAVMLFSPHLIWLYPHDFLPFEYASTTHGGKSLAEAALERARLSRRFGGYVAAPVIIVLSGGAARPHNDRRHDMASRRPAAAGRGRVLGAIAAAGHCSAGQPHRNHLALVDVGLDAVAGAAAVAAGSNRD